MVKVQNQSGPISTNKFYANFFLGNQNQGVWTHPYSLTWSKGGGNLRSWGMAVAHIDKTQRAFGPANPRIPGSPVQYFINPIGIQSIIFSAVEMSTSTVLSTRSLQAFSVNAILSPQLDSTSSITFPCLQGMGFVTALYNRLMPVIQSAVFFRSLVQNSSPRLGLYKFTAILEDGKVWLLYVRPTDGQDPRLQLVSNTQIQGVRNWTGVIQVAKNPSGSTGSAIYDSSAGVYPTRASVNGSISEVTGTYQLSWTKAGFVQGQSLLVFAFPHHTQSFDSVTSKRQTSLQLQTTTKGLATAVLSDSWTLIEPTLPTAISFAPWSALTGTRTTLSTSAKNIIEQVAKAELSQNLESQTNLDSLYFSGKALSKFAVMIYSTRVLLQQPILTSQALGRLKTAFAKFVKNKQIYPLFYDAKWGGLVSTGALKTGDANQDFGNTYYNDHHFHFGKSRLVNRICIH